jgi:predicted Zn-dependent protease
MLPGPRQARWSRVIGVVAAAGLSAVLPACVVVPTGPSVASGPLPSLGVCAQSPNYADSPLADQPPPLLLRWKNFPVGVYIDTVGVPAASASLYRDAVMAGVSTWSEATHGQVGGVVFTSTDVIAQVVIRVKTGNVSKGSGRTSVRYAGRLLLDATSEITRPDAEVSTGVLDAAAIRVSVAATVAHEMGHALGVMLHSPNGDDLMSPTIEPRRIGSPTTADLNTLLQAYCG